MDPDDSQSITFDEESVGTPEAAAERPSGLAAFIMGHSGGLVRNEKTAVQVLYAGVIILIIVSVFFFVRGTGATKGLSQAQIIQIIQNQKNQ